MTNIQVQKTLKKDILHLSLGILMLVLLPISAFIYHNLEPWYYIIPCYLGIVFFKGFMDTYALYKKNKSRKFSKRTTKERIKKS